MVGFAEFSRRPDLFLQELPELFDPLFQLLPFSRLPGGIIINMEEPVLRIIFV